MQYAEICANWLPRPKGQPPKPSATANLTTDNNNVGRKQQKRSLYTPNVVESAISEIATAYNRFLGALTLFGGQLYNLKTRTLAAAGL
jgi:isopenicillin N synthase-like dioxygenase